MRFLLVMLAACGAAHAPARPTGGTIAGLARDHDSGEVIAFADVRVTPAGSAGGGAATTTADNGAYHLDHLRPGRYHLVAEYARQTVTVDRIDVRDGAVAVVDLTFTLGQTSPISRDYGANDSAIDRYHPKNLAATTARIEGTVNDFRTRDRVAGAVITATRGSAEDVLQTVSDDQGRYQFDAVPPATYTVSAFYSIGGRGSIEVRRSEIEVPGGEAVVVPLWVELSKRN